MLKQLITSRRISLGLILLLAVLMYISTIIPQTIDSEPGKIEEWRKVHGGFLWLIDGIRLHALYSQPWFSVIILLAFLSIGISSSDQWTLACRKLSSTGSGEEVSESVAEPQLMAVASSHRYWALRPSTSGQLKFVKNPWGYFGVLLLHVGLTLVIAVSLYVSLTGRQGALILVEGEMRDARQSWDASEHGMFSSPLQLPGTIRLDKLEVGFGSKNQPQNVKSDISFFNESGSVDSLTASINGIIHYRGERIYHASQYGDAFTVTFTDRSGRVHSETIAMQQPLGLEKAGYSPDFRVAGSPCLYEAKYFADADKKSMRSGNALLSIRMLDKGREVARTALTIGQTGVLGEYQVRLIKVKKWAKIIFVDIKGMSVIFTGFAIIMLGGIIHYMTPPRELVGIMQPDGLYRVYWKAAAFKDFYHDERDEIVRELNRENIV